MVLLHEIIKSNCINMYCLVFKIAGGNQGHDVRKKHKIILVYAFGLI